MKIGLKSVLLISLLLCFLTLSLSVYANPVYASRSNAYVSKYVVYERETFKPIESAANNYYATPNNNPVYLKFNTLEHLKIGYAESQKTGDEKKSCATVRTYFGPSYQGFKGATYKTECTTIKQKYW